MAYVEDRWKATKSGKPERAGSGKRWRVRYKDQGGREHSRSFDRKALADKFCASVETDVDRGNWVDPALGKISLREYSAGWIAARNVEESSRERIEQRFRNHILPAFGDQSLTAISMQPSAIAAWLQKLPLAPVYKKSVFAHLSSCLEAAVDDGRIIRNPCKARSISQPKVVRKKIVAWTQERVDSVRAVLPRRYQALCDCGSGLGMRQGEVLALSPGDVDWLRGEVAITCQVRIVRAKAYFAPPKGGKDRTVPLPESVKLRLSAHLAEFPAVEVTLPWKDASGHDVTRRLIFTTSAGRAINRSYFDSHIWKDALAKAGVESCRANGFHALRHYFASSMLAGAGDVPGEDIRTVAEYLGHSDPGFTLKVYTHFIPGRENRMRNIVDALSEKSIGPEKALGTEEATGDVP